MGLVLGVLRRLFARLSLLPGPARQNPAGRPQPLSPSTGMERAHNCATCGRSCLCAGSPIPPPEEVGGGRELRDELQAMRATVRTLEEANRTLRQRAEVGQQQNDRLAAGMWRAIMGTSDRIPPDQVVSTIWSFASRQLDEDGFNSLMDGSDKIVIARFLVGLEPELSASALRNLCLMHNARESHRARIMPGEVVFDSHPERHG